MIKLFTNKQKKFCEQEQDIQYCEYLGSVGCGTYGSCSYRDGKILEHLKTLWLEATEDKPHGGQLLRARELGVLV